MLFKEHFLSHVIRAILQREWYDEYRLQFRGLEANDHSINDTMKMIFSTIVLEADDLL